MLLQIAEPGQSTRPHEHRLVVGIDLGTTHSLVATVKSGEPTVLVDEQGRSLLPSVVLYSETGEIKTGWNAWIEKDKNPTVIQSIKRLMGSSWNDVTRLTKQPNTLVSSQEGPVAIQTPQGPKMPVEVSSEILKTLKQRAESSLGGELLGAVITVPAYFDDAQRQATKDAAQLAGLSVLRLLNEPTAAAIAYGLDQQTEGIFAVYDLGGGTFDVSILSLQKGIFEVLATRGDTQLGGDDFDRVLLEHILENTVKKDASQSLSPHGYHQALNYVRQIKEKLSGQSVAVFEGLFDNHPIYYEIQRSEFETITQSLINQTLKCLNDAVVDTTYNLSQQGQSNFSKHHIKEVIMVGGATRMPHVQQAVEQWLGRPPLTSVNPDEVVALGAAIQANTLAGHQRQQENWLLLDITPLSLGIETMGGLVEIIIPRQSTLPTTRAQDFTTYQDGQTQMSIHVVQGERELVNDCRSLAKFTLKGIPPMTAGAARIRVQFSVDTDGLLSVSAKEQTTGTETSIIVKPSHGLDDGTLKRLLEDRFESHPLDTLTRQVREQCVEASRLLSAVNTALMEHRHYLENPQYGGSLQEYLQVKEGCSLLYKTLSSTFVTLVFANQYPDWLNLVLKQTSDLWLQTKLVPTPSIRANAISLEELKALSNQLDKQIQSLLKSSDGFATRRMNAEIQKALTGHSIKEVE